MNRVIITGGNGFIGKHLVKKILSCNLNSLTLISNSANFGDKYFSNRKFSKNTPLRSYTADIRDRKAISEILLRESADTCIHLAAKTSVPDSIKNPDETMEINANGTLNVLDACHRSKVNNFVFASSAAVYGDAKELPISENCFLRPLSPYGKSKMLAEQHVFRYRKLKKIQNTIVLRIFNVYGDGQVSESDVVTKFARRLSKGLPPVIYGDGKHTRDFISVDDVAEAIILSVGAMEDGSNKNYKSSLNPVFNIGTGTSTSIKELAQKMISISGLKLDPIYEEENQESRIILHSCANITNAKKALHFVPKKDFDTGLREVIEPLHLSKRVSHDGSNTLKT
ncbi:MAG TPA: NAD-dependent epimerase/dehydratase family protein [Nitrososphaeraceae archaeon]|nr:NAD-dependent epimerase/dehydratase family protein [Nitrososphaeraceae archaeon]